MAGNALGRHLDAPGAGQVLAGQRLIAALDVSWSALGDDAPAVDAGAGADVEHVIGGADGVLVVLDDDHRVAQVAQPLEGLEQTVVVALVQADRRLVEDIHHPHQAGADLAGQTNALGLAAGQRLGAALEVEIVEPDVDQEFQAGLDLVDDLGGDLALAAGQRERLEIAPGVADREAHDLRQGVIVDVDVARFAAQTAAVTGRAGLDGQVLGQILADHARFGLAVAALHVGQHALERVLAGDLAAAVVDVAEGDVVIAAAMQDDLALVAGQLVPWRLGLEAVVLGDRLQLVEVVDAAPVPALDHAFGQRQVGMADHFVGIEELLAAQAVAGRAGAGRVVEREHPRLELGDRIAAHRAGEACREGDVVALAVHEMHDGDAVGEIQRGLERFGEALLQVLADLEAVDHHADVVLLVLVQRRDLVELVDLAVDQRAHVALGAQLGEQLQMLALAALDHRRQQHQLAGLGQGQHLVDHLRDGLRLQIDVVLGAARRAGAGEQQAQVVVDLGDGADRRARVVRGRLLLDRDRRRQPFDMIDVGLFHHRQELARIGRQRFDVTALTLGIERVEGQRRLARAGQPGDHDQAVARQFDIDVLEVVGAGPTDLNLVHCHLVSAQKSNYTALSKGPAKRAAGKHQPGKAIRLFPTTDEPVE